MNASSPVLMALEAAGFKVDGIPRSGNSWLMMRCWRPDRHAHGDNKRSMGVELVYPYRVTCHGCGLRGLFKDLFPSFFGLYMTSAVREILGQLDTPSLAMPPSRPDVEAVYGGKLRELMRAPWPSQAIELLESKGVSLEVAKQFRCCWHAAEDPTKGAGGILFPVFSNGRCVGAQERPVDRRTVVRYKYWSPWPFSLHKYFFGVQKCQQCSDVFVVEGPFDAMHVHALGCNAVALLGKYLTDEKIKILRRLSPNVVYIYLDPDVDEQVLSRHAKQVAISGLRVRIVRKDRDPKYVTKEELDEIRGGI